MKKVSIVIVCMNHMENLDRCLPSIAKYTTKVDYEIYVVAYLFSKENLQLLKEKYPGKDILLVAHGGISRIVNAYFEDDMGNDEFINYLLDNCEVKRYEFK